MQRRMRERPLHGTLRRRLESCKSRYSTVDDIVNQLRSTYPDYHRTKHESLTRLVQQVLKPRAKHATKVSAKRMGHDDHAPRKRQKRVDEGLHLRKRMQGEEESQDSTSTSSVSSSNTSGSSGSEEDDDGTVDSTSTSSVSSSSTSGSSGSEEEDDGTVSVSTSEDAIYREKYEPPKKDDNVRKKKATGKAVNSKGFVLNGNCGGSKKDDNVRKKAATGKAVNPKGFVLNGNCGGSSDIEAKQKVGPRFRDLGGMKDLLKELRKVLVPFCRPEWPRELGVTPTTGILLHGPPGCGKTTLAHAIANETGLPFYPITATELVSGVSGESEENIRALFTKAYRTAPSIVFIDEIDSIGSKKENSQREMEKRIVTQLGASMENRLDSSNVHPGYVLVIGATNRPDALDPALRRPGRFDREFAVGIPDQSSREHILSLLTRNLKLQSSFDLKQIARSTPGYVSADLVALVNEAANLAMDRIFCERERELSQDLTTYFGDWSREPSSPEDLHKLVCTMSDFQEAVKKVQPSLRREGFSSVPNVKWEDVGGLDCLRKEFESSIIRPLKYPELHEMLGMPNETGLLLFGPPGCGKTLIAKAVANEAGANFIHVKGPELLNKFVGESEREVRQLFSRARACSPCIVFFDEIDALSTKRDSEGRSAVGVVNQLLIELDGGEQREGVFVIGATNRPNMMDKALLRAGRLGKYLYVPLPSADQRFSILKTLARKKPVDSTVDLRAIAEACENFSGADLAALMIEAGKAVVDEKLNSVEATSDDTITYKPRHFETALGKASPSVSPTERRRYERLARGFKVS